MKNREKLVDLCLETLKLTRNGGRLSKKTRVGVKMTVQLCIDMPKPLVKQGIEALEEFNSKLR